MKKIIFLSLLVAVLSSCSAMLDSSNAAVVNLNWKCAKIGHHHLSIWNAHH
ncbi:lipoprotein [Pedobacter frigidisoli]|uniref:lipoprotein n=1 Tax=Pedobacter frigidisoli TaxID=2530455 RepID=UPI0013F143CE